MRRPSSPSPASFRLLKAIAVVLALLLVVPGIDAVVRFAGVKADGIRSAEGLDMSRLTHAPDAFAALDQIEDALSSDDPVPDAFSEEIGLPSGAEDVRVSADGSIVGYSVSGNAADVLDRMTDRLESQGWTAVPLGGAQGSTFVKAEGRCTWALATCEQVGSATVVVVRCVMS